MSRHPLDHIAEKSADARADTYAEIERKSGGAGTHPAAKAVFRRDRGASRARTDAFMRIERGLSA